MRIEDIIWLPDIIDTLDWKHGVLPEEVDQVLFGRPLFREVQMGHVPGEDLCAALGRIRAGRCLDVFFVYKEMREAWVLSAREMDRKERKQYERR